MKFILFVLTVIITVKCCFIYASVIFYLVLDEGTLNSKTDVIYCEMYIDYNCCVPRSDFEDKHRWT